MRLRLLVVLFCVLLMVHNSCRSRDSISKTSSEFESEVSASKEDFPNYFSQITEVQFADLIGSITRRLQLPLYHDKGGATLGFFIPEINQAIKKKYGVEFEMMPSYGVTRTVIGATYAMIHKKMLEDPGQNPDHVINEIIQSSEPIPAFVVRGIGSDLDFTVRNRSGVSIDSLTLNKIKRDVVALLVDPTILKTGHSKDMDRSFFAIPDVKDYLEQTAWTRRQGGSEIDMIVYSLDDGKVIEPTDKTSIFADIHQGIYRYISGESMDKPSRQKQTIRGLRALVELPWIRLDSNSEKILIAEIQQLISDLEKDRTLGEDAISQSQKLLRNSWFSAANSRLWGNELVAVEVRSLNNLYYSIKKKMLIPKFLPYRSQTVEGIATIPQNLLMTREEFEQKYTENGNFYHATSRSGLAIVREGLFLSSEDQGRAINGPGSYCAKNRKSAMMAGSDSEFVFELKLRKKYNVKIFDFKENENDAWVTTKIAELGGRDKFFDYLREKIGIDIIVNQYILVQNAYSLVYPNSLRDLYDAAMAGDILNPKKMVEAYEMLEYAVNLYEYIKFSGEDVSKTKNPAELKDQLYLQIIEFVRSLDTSDVTGKSFKEFRRILTAIDLPPELIREKVGLIKNPNDKVLLSESLTVFAVGGRHIDLLEAVLDHPSLELSESDKSYLIKRYITDGGILKALWRRPLLVKSVLQIGKSEEVLKFVVRSIEADAILDQSLLTEILMKLEEPNIKLTFPPNFFGWLVSKGYETAAEAMLKNPKLDPNILYYRKAPLQIAIREKNMAMVQMLLRDRRVNLDSVVIDRRTPPDIANLLKEEIIRRKEPCDEVKEAMDRLRKPL